MKQLPELMENYKNNEKKILGGLYEKMLELFKKAGQMQKENTRGAVSVITVSYLQSSVLTGNYELRLDIYDRDFYLDQKECCTYWDPEFITKYILSDLGYFKDTIRFRIPQIKTYEIQQFADGYVVNYIYLLQQFLRQIFPQILDGVKSVSAIAADRDIKVFFGEFMGKGTVIMGELDS